MSRSLIVAIVAGAVGVPTVFTAGVVVALSFASGANPAETLKTVLGSVGDWVSGLGALSASLIAIYLADKQRRESLPKIKVEQSVDPYTIYFDIVSTGDRSVLLTGAFLRSRKQGTTATLAGRDVFPKRLDFADVLKLELDGYQYRKASNEICGEEDQPDLNDLEIVIESSMGPHVFPACYEVIGLISGTITISSSQESMM